MRQEADRPRTQTLFLKTRRAAVVRKSDLTIFKSCGFAIPPHRQLLLGNGKCACRSSALLIALILPAGQRRHLRKCLRDRFVSLGIRRRMPEMNLTRKEPAPGTSGQGRCCFNLRNKAFCSSRKLSTLFLVTAREGMRNFPASSCVLSPRR